MKGKDIAALGIANQRETTIVWDRATGKPVHPAIVWQDRRTPDLCDDLKVQGLEFKIQQKTGLHIDAYFSATQLKWLLDNVDGLRKQAKQGKVAFGTIDSWPVWKLTQGKVHITDVTNASRTMLYNIHQNEWDEEILDILDIPNPVEPEPKKRSFCQHKQISTRKLNFIRSIISLFSLACFSITAFSCFQKFSARKARISEERYYDPRMDSAPAEELSTSWEAAAERSKGWIKPH